MPGIVAPGSGHTSPIVSITVAQRFEQIHLIQKYTETTTVSSITTVTDSQEYLHPSGFWGPFDTENGII